MLVIFTVLCFKHYCIKTAASFDITLFHHFVMLENQYFFKMSAYKLKVNLCSWLVTMRRTPLVVSLNVKGFLVFWGCTNTWLPPVMAITWSERWKAIIWPPRIYARPEAGAFRNSGRWFAAHVTAHPSVPFHETAFLWDAFLASKCAAGSVIALPIYCTVPSTEASTDFKATF